MIFNKNGKTRILEKKAYKINKKETEELNNYYYGDFNNRTGDMNIFRYKYHLKRIIKKGKKRMIKKSELLEEIKRLSTELSLIKMQVKEILKNIVR